MFKCQQFHIYQEFAAMKVCSDSLIFGALAQAQGLRVADFGAGTGILSLICAQKGALSLDAVEMDSQALLDLRRNFAECTWVQKCRIFEGKIQNLPRTQPFDLILCNPPFFVESLKSQNPQRARARHNDELSYQDLLDAVCLHLDSGGVFQVLLPTLQCESFEDQARNYGLYLQRMVQFKATPVKSSHVSAMFFSRERPGLAAQEELCIWTIQSEYTQDSQSLLGELLLRFQS